MRNRTQKILTRTILPASLIFFHSLCAAGSGRVEIRVENIMSVDHSFRKQHWIKLGQCWGHPDDARIWTDESPERLTGSGSQGHLEKRVRGSQMDEFETYVPWSARWSGTVSAENDFSIEFAQTVNPLQRREYESICNREVYSSRINGLQTDINAVAQFVVPNHVRILRIRQTQFENVKALGIQTAIMGAAPIQTSSVNFKNPYSKPFKIGEYQYLFVDPGSEVNFHVGWRTDNLESLAVKVKFEVRMLGSDLCEQHFGTLGSRTNLAKVFKENLSEQVREESPHIYMERLACLRSPGYLRALVHHNSAAEVLEGINGAFGTSSKDMGKSGQEINLVSAMTVVDVARTLLKALSGYCDPKEIKNLFGIPTTQKVEIKGISFAVREMERLKFYLETGTIQHRLIDSYIDHLEKLVNQGASYADAMKRPPSKMVIIETYKTVSSKEFFIYSTIENAWNEAQLSPFSVSSNEDVKRTLANARQRSEEVFAYLKSSFYSFSGKSLQAVNVRDLKASLNSLKDAHNRLIKLMNSQIEWILDDQAPTNFRDAYGNLLFGVLEDSLPILNRFPLLMSGPNPFVTQNEIEDLFKRGKACLKNGN